jgi:hypothetical protein
VQAHLSFISCFHPFSLCGSYHQPVIVWQGVLPSEKILAFSLALELIIKSTAIVVARELNAFANIPSIVI